MGSELLTPQQLADVLEVDAVLLAEWRYRRQGPPYVKLGHRTVRYKRADVDRWLDVRTVKSGAA